MQQQQQLSDFVGEHGPYQLILTLILFLRYVLLGLMANSGSLMAPDVTFYCDLPMEEIVAIMPNITLLNKTEQELEIREEFKQICQLDLHLYQQAYLNATMTLNSAAAPHLQSQPKSTSSSLSSSSNPAAISRQQAQNASLAAQLKRQARLNLTTRIRECTEFTYDIAPDQGRTMTSEFDLVCERDWLRSLFQSLVSAAIVVAHVFWGTFSDNYGRFKAQKICLMVSLLAGSLSVLPVDFWTFTIARALCSFGDLGLVVSLTTTVVELVGSQYRGLSVALVNFGYALGVTLLPYIVAYFEDFRSLVGFTVCCHLLTVPFILATNESARWLLTNRKFKLARREVRRIARFNKGTQYCCSLWPLDWLMKGTKYGHHSQLNRTISSQQTKQTFDVSFKKFIEQIESQNLCDPKQDDTETSGVDQQEESSTNQQLPQRCNQCESSPSDGEQAAGVDFDIVITREDGGFRTQTTAPVTPTSLADDTNRLITTTSSTTKEAAADEDPAHLLRRSETAIPGVRSSNRWNSCGQLLDATTTRRGEAAPDGFSSSESPKAAEVQRRLSYSTGLLTELHALARRDSQALVSAQVGQNRQISGGPEKDDAEVIVKRRAVAHHQPDCINMVAHQLSFMGRVSRLFKDKTLMIAVFTIVWTTFNSELQYTSFIIINLEVGEDVYLNYMLGGCMEALAAITASLLLSYASRRHSLICFWLMISASCFGLSVAHIDSTWAVWLLALAKFSQSCLSSIASVAAYEAFPTFLRQSGSGLVFTLGGLGSVFAPLIFAEFDDHAGMDRVLMTFSASSLTAATLIYLFLRETRNCELQ